MAKRRVGLLFLLLTLLASNPPTVLADDSAPRHSAQYQQLELLNDVEWFGMNLGGGWAGDFNALKADVLLFTLRWPLFYWTVLEVYPSFLFGFLGAGTRMGGRMYVGTSGRGEIRVGLGMGGGMFTPYHSGWFTAWSMNLGEEEEEDVVGDDVVDVVAGVVLIPHVQYIYNFEHINVGVGLDLMIGVSPYKTTFHCTAPCYAIGPMVYFRFAVH